MEIWGEQEELKCGGHGGGWLFIYLADCNTSCGLNVELKVGLLS